MIPKEQPFQMNLLKDLLILTGFFFFFNVKDNFVEAAG